MSQQNVDNKKSFSQSNFDRIFQEKIVQALLTDKQWASQMAEVLEVEYFEYAYLRHLASKYIGYYHKHKEFPSLDLFIPVMKEFLSHHADSVLSEQVVNVIKKTKANVDLGDLHHVKETTLAFCREQSFRNALVECISLIGNPEQYDKAVEIVKKAISAGQTQSPGLSLENDIDARYSTTYRACIPTKICVRDKDWAVTEGDSLDSRKILAGGAGSGELNVVIAPTGVGKSHFLVHVGAQAMLEGKNVLHFTFELEERAVGIRYDSHFLGIDSLECPDRISEIKEFYEQSVGLIGKLRIKKYPTGSATVNTLRSFVDKLSLEGFRPDMIVVDYAGIMRSTEKYELPRFELKKIYEELRGLAGELGLPIWTACQSNKEGAESEIISLANMAEAYAQAHICDFVVGLGRPESQKASGRGTLFIAKNRNGIDGVLFKVRIDTARSRISILSDEEVADLEAEKQKDKEESFSVARKQLQELHKSKKKFGVEIG